jgi:hypothetical protein
MRAQAGAHVAQLGVHGRARHTAGQVRVDAPAFDTRGAARRVRAELLQHRPARGGAALGGQVGLQIGGTQALPRAAGQRGRGVGAEPEVGGDRGRPLPLDLHLPEHPAPALRKAAERAADEVALGQRADRVEAGRCAVGQLLVADRHVTAAHAPLKRHTPGHDQQVAAHVVHRTGAPADRLKHAEEGLGREVVRLGPVVHQPEREPVHGGRMPRKQLAESRILAGAKPYEQCLVLCQSVIDRWQNVTGHRARPPPPGRHGMWLNMPQECLRWTANVKNVKVVPTKVLGRSAQRIRTRRSLGGTMT